MTTTVTIVVPLTDAEQAAIAAGESATIDINLTVSPPAIVVTAPIPTPTPTPVPPPTPAPTYPQTGPNVIYNGAQGGKLLWPGDWSGGGVKINYNDTLNGETVMSVEAVSPYPYWLPYAPLTGPNGTPTLETQAYTHLVIQGKFFAAADTPTAGAYTYTVTNGVVQGDVSTGAGTGLKQYLTGTNPDGTSTYVVPLSAINAVNIPLYKIIIQDSECPVGSKWYVRYAAFV